MHQMTRRPQPSVVLPDPQNPRLTELVAGIDHTGAAIEVRVPVERALTLYLNAQEIVTMMTIGDYPEYLALGYLLNQNMLLPDDVVTEVEYDEDLRVVVVRTERNTDYEQKLKKRTQTSGCAQGTAFGDLLEAIEDIALPAAELRTSWLYALTHKINTTPSLYLEAGHHIVGQKHVLVQEVAERQIFGIVVDRHHGDDLLRVEIKRQGALDGHADLYRRASMVDARNQFRQPRVLWVRHDDGLVRLGYHLVHAAS